MAGMLRGLIVDPYLVKNIWNRMNQPSVHAWPVTNNAWTGYLKGQAGMCQLSGRKGICTALKGCGEGRFW